MPGCGGLGAPPRVICGRGHRERETGREREKGGRREGERERGGSKSRQTDRTDNSTPRLAGRSAPSRMATKKDIAAKGASRRGT